MSIAGSSMSNFRKVLPTKLVTSISFDKENDLRFLEIVRCRHAKIIDQNFMIISSTLIVQHVSTIFSVSKVIVGC